MRDEREGLTNGHLGEKKKEKSIQKTDRKHARQICELKVLVALTAASASWMLSAPCQNKLLNVNR